MWKDQRVMGRAQSDSTGSVATRIVMRERMQTTVIMRPLYPNAGPER